MNALDKMTDLMKIPKSIYDSIERFGYTLFGKFINQSGELLADKVKYQRFKNQVKIFEKARVHVEKAGLNDNQIDLKLLVPMLDSMSLESKESVQDKWAKIIANICFGDTDQSFDPKCIEIMKQISDREILMLDLMYEELIKLDENDRRMQRREKAMYFEVDYNHKRLDSFIKPFPLKEASSSAEEWEKRLGVNLNKVNLYIERLISFNLIKSRIPDLERDGREEYLDEMWGRFPVEVYSLRDSGHVHLTQLGIYFVELCKFPKQKQYFYDK